MEYLTNDQSRFLNELFEQQKKEMVDTYCLITAMIKVYQAQNTLRIMEVFGVISKSKKLELDGELLKDYQNSILLTKKI